MNVFGERLKSLRDKNKQSINELVLELNKKYETSISKSMISRYENGQWIQKWKLYGSLLITLMYPPII